MFQFVSLMTVKTCCTLGLPCDAPTLSMWKDLGTLAEEFETMLLNVRLKPLHVRPKSSSPYVSLLYFPSTSSTGSWSIPTTPQSFPSWLSAMRYTPKVPNIYQISSIQRGDDSRSARNRLLLCLHVGSRWRPLRLLTIGAGYLSPNELISLRQPDSTRRGRRVKRCAAASQLGLGLPPCHPPTKP